LGACGALSATPIGLTVAWVGTPVEHLPPGSIRSSPIYVAAALIPPAVAVLGYNLSRPKAEPVRPSLLEAPEFRLRVEIGEDGSFHTMLDLRLVNARF